MLNMSLGNSCERRYNVPLWMALSRNLQRKTQRAEVTSEPEVGRRQLGCLARQEKWDGTLIDCCYVWALLGCWRAAVGSSKGNRARTKNQHASSNVLHKVTCAYLPKRETNKLPSDARLLSKTAWAGVGVVVWCGGVVFFGTLHSRLSGL